MVESCTINKYTSQYEYMLIGCLSGSIAQQPAQPILRMGCGPIGAQPDRGRDERLCTLYSSSSHLPDGLVGWVGGGWMST